MMVALRSPAGASVRSWIYYTIPAAVSIITEINGPAQEGWGGATSSNPQILLGADEGTLFSVEYARRVAAAVVCAEKWSSWVWDPCLAVTVSGW